MTLIKTIEPNNWDTFLNEFIQRNKGRRARFEVFAADGDFSEEEQEGTFESISIKDHSVLITRTYEKHGSPATMEDELKNIRGIAVQYDTDDSENMLEFTDDKESLTTLHFESKVDGDS